MTQLALPNSRPKSGPWSRLALAAALALPLAAVCQQSPTPQQQAPAPDPQPATPHGKVLFEHHEPALTDDPPDQSTPPPPAPASTRPGISTSQKQPRTLRRRTPADADATPQPQPETVVEAATERTASSSEPADTGPILITEADLESAAKISTQERLSTTIAGTALDLHLNTHTGATETRAQLTIRNTGTEPLLHLPLRISGALHWESARVAGTAAAITQHHLADDLDHTGAATELALTLPQPLAPGASIALDLFYAGTLRSDDQRLLTLGAPPERALRTDWDTVSDTFTGLRGIGNVLWYPVADPPASLRDAAAVPQTVEHARAQNASAPFSLHLALQYTGTRPEAAFFCGERKLLKPLIASADTDQIGTSEGAVVADWNRTALGPHTPSLFVAQAAPQTVATGLLRVVTDRPDTAAALGEAAAKLRPMLSDWLGALPVRPLDVIDLPIPGAAGFSDGSLLVAPLTTAPAATLAPALVGPLTAAWMPAEVAASWLRDGIPAFLQAVWAERTEGRTAALTSLAATRTRFTQAQQPAHSQVSTSATEPDSTPSSEPSNADLSSLKAGTSLATCADPACARAKSAYVLEMLRGMLGDAALQQALSGWRNTQEKKPQRTAAAETADFESLLQQVSGKRDLAWFFQSWIDADHGLPELSIITVAPRRVERSAPINYLPPRQAVGGPIGPEPVPKPGDPDSIAKPSITPGDKIAPAPGSWLVAVEVQNAGGADADVPVTVRSGGLTNTLRLHVPAHGRATIRVPFEADPEEVLVNDGSVPEVRSSQHRRSIGTLAR